VLVDRDPASGKGRPYICQAIHVPPPPPPAPAQFTGTQTINVGGQTITIDYDQIMAGRGMGGRARRASAARKSWQSAGLKSGHLTSTLKARQNEAQNRIKRKKKYSTKKYEEIKKWTTRFLTATSADGGKGVKYCNKYSVETCPANYQRKSKQLSFEKRLSCAKALQAAQSGSIPGSIPANAKAKCLKGGEDVCHRNGHDIRFGTQSCNVNLDLKTDCAPGGCATSTNACIEKRITQVFAVLDCALALIPIAGQIKTSIKTARLGVKQGVMTARKAAAKLTKKALRASARHLKQTAKDMIKEKLQEIGENFALTIASDPFSMAAFDAAISDAAETVAATAYVEELNGDGGEWEVVKEVVTALDPTGISGLVEAFNDPSCDEINGPPPAVGAPDGEEFEYRWVPVCGHSFAKNDHGANQVCRDAGYSGGKVTRQVSTGGEPAFYSRGCKQGESLGSCTGSSGGPHTHQAPATVAAAIATHSQFTASSNPYGMTSAMNQAMAYSLAAGIDAAEERESGGAAANSVGEGYCADDEATTAEIQCW
jgi:hypothetical protein